MMASSMPFAQRNQAVAAFEGEALLPDVLVVQVAFQAFRGRQLAQDVLLFIGRKAPPHLRVLEGVLQPQALLGVRDVRELGADRVHVDRREHLQDGAQRCPLREHLGAAAGEEFAVEVTVGQAKVRKLEYGRLFDLLQSERVEPRAQVAAVRIDLDQPRYRALPGGDLVGGFTAARALRVAVAGPFGQLAPQRTVGHVGRARAGEGLKVAAPGRVDGGRVAQEVFVEILDEIRVATGQHRGGELVSK